MSGVLDPQNLPPVFVASVGRVLGAGPGAVWLREACAAASVLCADWGVEPVRVFEGGVNALCVLGRQRGDTVVLKFPPTRQSGLLELRALRVWDGNPQVPAPLHIDVIRGAYTMRFAAAVDRQPSAAEAFNLAASLHVTPPSGVRLPDLRSSVRVRVDRARRYAVAAGWEWLADLRHAERMVLELLATTRQATVVHGDFQRKNLIVGRSALTAIAPEVCVGDPLYDVAMLVGAGTFGRPAATTLGQMQSFGEAEDSGRLLAWAWALCVLDSHPGRLAESPERQEFIAGYRGRALAV
jgi:hypothetical protein